MLDCSIRILLSLLVEYSKCLEGRAYRPLAVSGMCVYVCVCVCVCVYVLVHVCVCVSI